MLISYGDFVYSFFYFLFEEESSKMLCQYIYVSALHLYLMFVTHLAGGQQRSGGRTPPRNNETEGNASRFCSLHWG